MHCPLKVHVLARFLLARIPPLIQRFFLRGQIVLRSRPLAMNQRTLMQAEDVVLRGEKGNLVRILNCPLAFG